MPSTTNFSYTYVTPFDPAYKDLWGPVYNTLHTNWDNINGRVGILIPLRLPEDATFYVTRYFPYPFTIEKVVSQCSAGTATATVKINGTSLGGTANSVSTSTQTQSHSSANTLSEGDDLTVVLSSTSSDCADVTLEILGKRTGPGTW